jgi:hypothetical protein
MFPRGNSSLILPPEARWIVSIEPFTLRHVVVLSERRTASLSTAPQPTALIIASLREPLITLSREVAEEASGAVERCREIQPPPTTISLRPLENGGAKLRSRGSSSSRAPLMEP